MTRNIARSFPAALALLTWAHNMPVARGQNLQPAPSHLLLMGDQTKPPIGWQVFCRRYEAECHHRYPLGAAITFNNKNWNILVDVNKTVNGFIKPAADIDHWGIIDQWDIPTAKDPRGDCEDYVLKKRHILIEEHGFPAPALLPAIVRDKDGTGHAVLLARTDRGDVVLDNQQKEILTWPQSFKTMQYKPVKALSPENEKIWLEAWRTLEEMRVAQVAFSSPAP